MEWTYPLEGRRGAVTVRAEGARAGVRVRLADDGLGLYKVWLLGKGGAFPLGTLLPEGGELHLERSIPVSTLEERGFWPPAGAEVRRTFTFGEAKKHPERGPLGFEAARPDRVLGDPVLRGCGEGTTLWARRTGEQTLLLMPFRTDGPLPLVPAFCLMGVVEREGRRWLTLRLDGRGWPILPPPTEEELF